MDTRTGEVFEMSPEMLAGIRRLMTYGDADKVPGVGEPVELPKDWVEVHKLANEGCSHCNGRGHMGKGRVTGAILLCPAPGCVLERCRGEIGDVEGVASLPAIL